MKQCRFCKDFIQEDASETRPVCKECRKIIRGILDD